MNNNHLTREELIKLAEVKAKHSIATKKANKIVEDKLNKIIEANPEMTESEVDECARELLEHETSKLTFSNSENDLFSHVYQCFHCENKLNKIMGIEEDLIIKDDDM